MRRGLGSAKRVVVLGDGAKWIKNLANKHFPEAIQIIDLYHAKEHVSNLCKILFSGGERQTLEHLIRWWTHLDYGQVEKIIHLAEKKLPRSHQRAFPLKDLYEFERRGLARVVNVFFVGQAKDKYFGAFQAFAAFIQRL